MHWAVLAPILVSIVVAACGAAALVTRWAIDNPRAKRLEDITEAQYWEPQVKQLREDIKQIRDDATREVAECNRRLAELTVKCTAIETAKDRDIQQLETQIARLLLRVEATEQTAGSATRRVDALEGERRG